MEKSYESEIRRPRHHDSHLSEDGSTERNVDAPEFFLAKIVSFLSVRLELDKRIRFIGNIRLCAVHLIGRDEDGDEKADYRYGVGVCDLRADDRAPV